MTDPSISIRPADPETDWAELRELLVDFHEWMADHEERYDPAAELATDSRSLTEETECWAWIAELEGGPAGCVLLYGQTDELAEFRRLWVDPGVRERGIGRALTATVIETARSQGYGTLGLTTPPWSEAAQALYESIGFERTPPYPETRLPEKHHEEAIFMQLDLTTAECNPIDR